GLNIKHATYHPKATENIDEIIKIIKTLEEKGFAYNLDGDVYFRAKKFDEYGKLSHMPLDELEAGVRKELDERKEDPMDFVLWKKQKSPDEPAWESPWGLGRPGWHIECSAMANRFLGKTIDIHCGGRDLIFPHHENEIAQSECANGVPFARYWMHNGFINIDNQKMSKSLNNFLLVRDLSKIYGYEAIRFFMLSAHYRSPINFSDELIKQSQAGLERLYNCIENLDFLISKSQSRGVSEEVKGQVEKYKNSFIEAMDDDLNTADAISVLFELAKYANTYCAGENLSKDDLVLFKETFMELGGVLGIFYSKKDETLDSEIEELINLRQKARSEKNFKEADRIRDLLKEKGIILLDTPQGVKWKRI
ncbi:MAG: cysteine--tRNA ligase, partial [Clostridiaceae bacterium]|nr:cysteine--tRNA ligase [Clostridiaceae bacterium]